jgi:hypothetical protein
VSRGRRAPLAGALAFLAGCSGPSGPVLTFYREITAGQLYGLGFEITTVRIERPDRGRLGEAFPVVARLAIEQKGASAARPVEAERSLDLTGGGCVIQLESGATPTEWRWRVLPQQRGPLRLTLDLTGLPGPFTSCKLDGRYVACPTLQKLELLIPIE